MKTIAFILAFLYASCLFSYAKFCQQLYEDGNSGERNYVSTSSDGGYVFTGNVDGNFYVIKTDSGGVEQWHRTYGGAYYDNVSAIHQTNDGGYILAGVSASMFEFKISEAGDSLWQYPFDNSTNMCSDMKVTPDGGFLFLSQYSNFGNSSVAIKVGSNGYYEWETPILAVCSGVGLGSVATSVALTNDGGYIVANKTAGYVAQDTSNILFGNQPFITKINADGSIAWQRCCFNSIDNLHIAQLGNGNYLLVCSREIAALPSNIISTQLVFIDPNGEILSTQQSNIDFPYSIIPQSIVASTDGGAVICHSNGVAKISVNGNWEWQSYFDQPSITPSSIANTPDGGFIVSGRKKTDPLSNTAFDACLLKLDSLGNICKNYLSGYVFSDSNNNCLLDANETTWNNVVVKLEGSNRYAVTNNNGYYYFAVDTGNDSISVLPPNQLWNVSCPNPNQYQVSVNLPQPTVINNLNFGLQPNANCPLMGVTLASGFTRPCFDNQTTIKYYNNGTTVANNASVSINLPNDMTIRSASMSFTQIGNNCTFLLGDVPPLTQGSIYLTDSISCNAIVGNPITLIANVLPNTPCGTLSPNSTDTLTRLLTNSFDPNKKTVLANNTDLCLSNSGNEIQYTTYFQNTGTDTAYTVKITDLLADQFDILSVTNAITSHPGYFEINYNTRQLIWLFDNIMLPDSISNEAASHGFVQYTVKLLNSAVTFPINSQSAIYFDYNTPIYTNIAILDTCETLIIDQITANTNTNKQLVLYPNPAQNTITLVNATKNNNYPTKVFLFDLLGTLVQTVTLNNSEPINIDLQFLQNGMYFCKSDDGQIIGKFLVVKNL